MLRKEHKKKCHQEEQGEVDRLERKNYRKNKSRERTCSEDYAEHEFNEEDQ